MHIFSLMALLYRIILSLIALLMYAVKILHWPNFLLSRFGQNFPLLDTRFLKDRRNCRKNILLSSFCITYQNASGQF